MNIRLIGIVCALVLYGCQPRTESVVGQTTAHAPATVRHMIRSERLRNIMREMELLMFDRMYTDLALEKELARHAREFQRAAVELAATARDIPAVSRDVDLQEQQRAVFRDLAEALAVEAGELARLAGEQQYGAIAPQYERVTHICASCHSLFRGGRGNTVDGS